MFSNLKYYFNDNYDYNLNNILDKNKFKYKELNLNTNFNKNKNEINLDIIDIIKIKNNDENIVLKSNNHVYNLVETDITKKEINKNDTDINKKKLIKMILI